MQIALLSFNHPELTHRAAISALGFASGLDIHLIHNGSRPDVVEQLQTQLPQVNHHWLKDNRGYSGGVNFALDKVFAIAPWALLLTNDCEIQQLGSPPVEPGFYAPQILVRKTGRVDSLGGKVNLVRAHLSHLKARDHEMNYVPGTAFWLHRNVWQSAGPFDESLHTYWEDVDFSLRVQKHGGFLGLTEETQIRHGIGKTCHKDTFYTTYLYQRNRATVSRRHLQGKIARLRLEANLAWELSRNFWRLMRARRARDGALVVRAYLDALK
jgi:GT2 family glycosyltransferase